MAEQERAQPPGKRRAGSEKNKDNADDDDEPSIDPGEWKPSGDSEAIRQRRRVHVRRAGQPSAAAAAAEPAAPAAAGGPSSNPFAGVSLTAPAAAPANPFSGVCLIAPSQQAQETGKAAAEEPNKAGTAGPITATSPATATAPAASPGLAESGANPGTSAAGVSAAAPSVAAATTSPAGASQPPAPASTATAPAAGSSDAEPAPTPTPSSNPFSALGSTGGTFGAGLGGGGFGSLGKAATGGGFGVFGSGLGAGSGAAGTSSAAPVFGSFNFGSGAFPPVAAAPFGAKPAGQKDAEDGGEGEEQGEQGGGDEAVQVFGGQGPSYQPVVNLPELEKKTGEEEERQLFAADGSLYEFDIAANKWRERGRGEFKVNASEAGTRMVMRQAGNLRLLLNAKVYVNMPVQLMPGGVGVTFGVINAAVTGSNQEEREAAKEKSKPAESSQEAHEAVPAKPHTWAVRIKNAEKVTALKELLTKLRENPKAEGCGGTAGGWDAA